jgi:hypothetical protein
MTMAMPLRKFMLTIHVTSSVGFFGSVAAFLSLSIAGYVSGNEMIARSSYLSMEWMAWYVIVPLCVASFVSGIAQSLGTPWGLIRHYWIIVKLCISLLSAAVLVLHMRPIAYMAERAMEGAVSGGSFDSLRIQLIANAGMAALALVMATVLSVYKPKGITRYAAR